MITVKNSVGGGYDGYKKAQEELNHRKVSSGELGSFGHRVGIFRGFFSQRKIARFFQPGKVALCLGARRGEEVAALRERGLVVTGIDLVECPPFVLKGDFHDVPFEEGVFDVVFCNSVDHLYLPQKFVSEIERVLCIGGIAVLALMVGVDSEEMSFVLSDVTDFVKLFKKSVVIDRVVPNVKVADELSVVVLRKENDDD